MRRLITKTLLPLLVLAGAAAQAGTDERWETLRAINQVENPTNHTRMGRFGELGPYQFRPGTWRMHTRKPFRQAVERAAADEVAVKHYEWIRRNLEGSGVDATPFNIALAWNTGVDNVVKGRAPTVSYNYAERVVNLVHAFRRERPAPTLVAASTASTVAPKPVSLDRPALLLSAHPEAPRFTLAEPPPPAPDPVVYTSHEPAPEEPLLVFSTTATLAPRFSLVPGL